MYNTEQKSKFVKENITAVTMREYVLWFFNAFEPYEEQWGSDMCTRSSAEIEEVFKKMTGFRAKTKYRPLTTLKMYIKWCIQNNVPNTNSDLLNYDNDGIDKMRHTTVRNPRHLQLFLDALCEPEENQTIDNNLRTYCWLAYSGMKSEDVFEVRSSNVDFDKMQISFNGRFYPIYVEALPAIRNCVTLRSYIYPHGNYTELSRQDRQPGDILLRGIKATQNPDTMRVLLANRKREAMKAGKTDLDLSYKKIWFSGIFYQMYQMEQGGAPVDFSGIIDFWRDGKPYKLDSGKNTQESRIRQVSGFYKEDYERWKQTLL